MPAVKRQNVKPKRAPSKPAKVKFEPHLLPQLDVSETHPLHKMVKEESEVVASPRTAATDEIVTTPLKRGMTRTKEVFPRQTILREGCMDGFDFNSSMQGGATTQQVGYVFSSNWTFPRDFSRADPNDATKTIVTRDVRGVAVKVHKLHYTFKNHSSEVAVVWANTPITDGQVVTGRLYGFVEGNKRVPFVSIAPGQIRAYTITGNYLPSGSDFAYTDVKQTPGAEGVVNGGRYMRCMDFGVVLTQVGTEAGDNQFSPLSGNVITMDGSVVYDRMQVADLAPAAGMTVSLLSGHNLASSQDLADLTFVSPVNEADIKSALEQAFREVRLVKWMSMEVEGEKRIVLTNREGTPITLEQPDYVRVSFPGLSVVKQANGGDEVLSTFGFVDGHWVLLRNGAPASITRFEIGESGETVPAREAAIFADVPALPRVYSIDWAGIFKYFITALVDVAVGVITA